MNLPNKYFTNFPIEFKEINPEDFISENKEVTKFIVDDKIIINPDDNGYIHKELSDKLSLKEKNTVVINAPVGYGKSYTILKTIKKIHDEIPNSKIIVATPFVSLVKQYVNDIKNIGIPEKNIYDYTNLGRNPKEKYNNKKIHVITVNTLLGNPGEDGFKNSIAKRMYLDKITLEAELKNEKVFFIYDEIHDTIQNFKEEFIFYLWKWSNVIHKNIIVSATFNEASKVVIKYLAELTDFKIQIIESVRKRFPEKQSELFLHYSSDFSYDIDTKEIVNVINDLLNRDRNVDILCYSKNLAKSILRDNKGIGKRLKEKFGILNDCTSQLVLNQRMENVPPKNRFNNEMCNIGTNFKSGVNIIKENHSFVIIMPPNSSRMFFRNKFGIFSNGVNNVIQALARQRKKGEIHIILPRPDKFNIESLSEANMSESQIKMFEHFYKEVEGYTNSEVGNVNYIPLKKQDYLIKNHYENNLLGYLQWEIRKVEKLKPSRATLPRLEFPPYEIYKLNRGEEYLSNTFEIFGEDISAFVTYSAFTNQFINCNLVKINKKEILFFEEGKIQSNLKTIFNNHFGENYFNLTRNPSNFSMFYNRFREELFQNYQLKIKNQEKWNNILPYKNKEFEVQLLLFCNYLFESDYVNIYSIKNDIAYTRGNYILDSIYFAEKININSLTNKEEICLIQAYQYLGELRNRLIKAIKTTSRGTKYNYLPVKSTIIEFVDLTEIQRFEDTIKALSNYDILFKNDIFNFKRNFIEKDLNQKIQSLYTILIEDFFEIKDFKNYPRVTINESLERVKPIINTFELDRINKVNLIESPDFDKDYLTDLEEYIIENTHYENLDEYFKNIIQIFY